MKTNARVCSLFPVKLFIRTILCCVLCVSYNTQYTDIADPSVRVYSILISYASLLTVHALRKPDVLTASVAVIFSTQTTTEVRFKTCRILTPTDVCPNRPDESRGKKKRER